MKIRYFAIYILFALITPIIGCATRFAAQEVDAYNWCYVTKNQSVNCLCDYEDNAFTWHIKITRADLKDKYILEGHGDPREGSMKSFASLLRSKSYFYLVLSNDNVIVHSVPFMPLGNDFGNKLYFEKEFECTENFNRAAIWWKIWVKG